MNPFEAAPEFASLDNRRYRSYSPVTAEQLFNKHEALFPAALVKGKTILDLGCALGATGHWCLSAGAAHYVGVEVQDSYAREARALLEKYHPGKSTIHTMPIERYLGAGGERSDIVSALGVLYVYVDYYSILKEIADRAKETIAIEGLYPMLDATSRDFCGVQFLENQRINLADENASLQGRGARVSPKGLEFLMRDFGFASEGLIYPRPIMNSPDPYNTVTTPGNARFLIRFSRTGDAARDLSEDLGSGQLGPHAAW